MKHILIIFLALAILFTIPANAQDATPVPLPKGDYAELRLTGTETVAQVIDPLRVRLADQRIVQLVPLEIPDMDPYAPGDVAAAALAFMKEQLEGQQVRIYQVKNEGAGRVNRMGHVLAHLERKDGEVWIQGALLANGLARIRPAAENTEMATQMLGIQLAAQNEKRGLWADSRYAVHTPDMASFLVGSYGTIEGTVRANAMSKNVVYLNFGPDWRTDFTIGIEPDLRRKLSNMGINPLAFAGKKVRVQGWVENYNGPYVALTHPAWIEVLPEGGEASMVGAGENN